MEYKEALEYLESFSKYDIKLGLERLEELLSKIEYKKCKYIHIAGTNGKGSTTKYISNILIEQGYKVGTFQSPYIEDLREMIQINNTWISEKQFSENMEKIKDVVSYMKEKPTYFEILTALSLISFSNCDFACIEVGLGGRYDATNVITNTLVSVITAISYDHMDYLGSTIEEIAYNKAGIIKSKYTVVYPKQDKKVLEVIEKEAKKMNSKLIIAQDDGLEYEMSMLGDFQKYNIQTAITAIKCIGGISEKSIREGIKKTKLAARMEVLSKKPLIILDGAHNEAAAIEMEKFLKKINKEIVMICAILKDKEYEKIFAKTLKYANKVYVTEIDNKRAMSKEELLDNAKKYSNNVEKLENLEEVIESIDDNKILVIFGSLYLASSIRPKILELVK